MPLTFYVSGMLWTRSLIMKDVETGSEWSHLLGRAMRGKLQGTELEILPAIMTDWKTWREENPHTDVVVLSFTTDRYGSDRYWQRHSYVMGYVKGNETCHWSFPLLDKTPVRNDRLGSAELLVVYEPATCTARLFSRRLENDVLLFEQRDGALVDRNTHSRWNIRTGESLAGPLAGKKLRQLPGIISFDNAWRRFHPESELATIESGS